MLQAMRDNPALARTKFGMSVQAKALERISGTDWERVLFAVGTPDAQVVEFRRKHDEIYPPQPEPVLRISRGARLPKGITTCSICRCHCIDAGGPATVCLGCVAEGRQRTSERDA